MTGILIPRKQVWTRQPQVLVRPSPRFRRGLYTLFHAPQRADLSIEARPLGINNSSSIYPIVGGCLGMEVNGQVSDGVFTSRTRAELVGVTAFAICAIVQKLSSDAVCICPNWDGSGSSVFCSILSTGQVGFGPKGPSDQAYISKTTAAPFADNKPHTLVCYWSYYTYRCFVDGVEYPLSEGLWHVAHPVILEGGIGSPVLVSSDTYSYGRIFHQASWINRRDLPLQDLSVNPWQIFAQQTRSIFVPTASGGAYTLTAAQGTFTETGNNAGLTAQRNISASQGSFAESGQSTGLNAQRKIAASQGSFAESGQAADLTKTGSYSLTASQGSFAESGQVAGLTAQRKIGAEPGSISLIGQAATLTKTTAGQYVLTAAGGAFAETGSAAGLAAQRNLAVSYASFALSGQTAGLLKGRSLQAAYGSFSETGQSTNLTAQRLLASSAGSIVLAGGVVTFRHIIPGEVAPIAAEFAIRPPEYRWGLRPTEARWGLRPTEARWAIHQN